MTETCIKATPHLEKLVISFALKFKLKAHQFSGSSNRAADTDINIKCAIESHLYWDIEGYNRYLFFKNAKKKIRRACSFCSQKSMDRFANSKILPGLCFHYIFLYILTTTIIFFLPSLANQRRQHCFGLHLIDTDILLDKCFISNFLPTIWIYLQ